MDKRAAAARLLKDYGTILAGLAVVAVFGLLSPDKFFTLGNLFNITRQISLLVIIALGATLVMTVDEFDLSVGGMASLGGVLAALLAADGQPMAVCFTVPLAAGLAVGLLNGWIITRFRVLSFVSTLAMNTILTGVIYYLTGGGAVFQSIPRAFSWLGNAALGRLPLLTVIMLVLTVLLHLVMTRLVFGRRLYAIGGNMKAARLSGVRTKQMMFFAYTNMGFIASVAGLVFAARLNSASPVAGQSFEMDAIARCFIGGASAYGGTGTVGGALIGALIMGVLNNGMSIMGISSNAQQVVKGLVLLIAVAVDVIGKQQIQLPFLRKRSSNRSVSG